MKVHKIDIYGWHLQINNQAFTGIKLHYKGRIVDASIDVIKSNPLIMDMGAVHVRKNSNDEVKAHPVQIISSDLHVWIERIKGIECSEERKLTSNKKEIVTHLTVGGVRVWLDWLDKPSPCGDLVDAICNKIGVRGHINIDALLGSQVATLLDELRAELAKID